MRPKREDRFDKIQLICIICKVKFLREKFLEESRIQQNKLGPVCSPKCSGILGYKIKCNLKRESSLLDKS
jgi:hypothetical protein